MSMGEFRRRQFLFAAGTLLAAPRFGIAQQPGRSYRLGWIGTTALRSQAYNIAFVQRLGELGFVEGRNLVIEFKLLQGPLDKLPDLASELARLKCDLFFAPGNELTLRAFRQATRDTPIVISANDYDPVAAGHIDSLAHPGGRITGVSMLQTELPSKRLEVLRELLPKVRRVAVLADVSTAGQLKLTQVAAAKLGFELLVHEFSRTPYDYSAAFAAFARGKAEALVALASGFFVPAREQVVALAQQSRLPSVFSTYVWAEIGGLLSYGPNFPAVYRRAAEQVVKVLNGANPGELPVEQANVVEMVINLKTAKALGLAIPQSLRLRADRIIE
jgi:putative ABC transport system substrate-binding protein